MKKIIIWKINYSHVTIETGNIMTLEDSSSFDRNVPLDREGLQWNESW